MGREYWERKRLEYLKKRDARGYYCFCLYFGIKLNEVEDKKLYLEGHRIVWEKDLEEVVEGG